VSDAREVRGGEVLVTVERRVGHFDLLHPDTSSVIYIFKGLPWGLEEFRLLEKDDPEFETDDIAISIANALYDMLKPFWGSQSHCDRLGKIIKYLNDNREAQETLFAEKRVKQLTDRILVLDNELVRLKKRRGEFEDWLDGNHKEYLP
jgi:hypothetical protein